MAAKICDQYTRKDWRVIKLLKNHSTEDVIIVDKWILIDDLRLIQETRLPR